MIFNYIRESYSNWISRNPSKIKPEYLIQWPLDTCTVKLVIIEIYMYFEIARGHFKCIILLKLFYMRSLSPLRMKAFAHGGRNLHSNRIRQGGFKGGGAPLRGVRRTPATAFLQEYLEIVTAGENLERLPTALRLNTRYNRFLTTIIEAHTTCPRHEPRFFSKYIFDLVL